MGFEIIGVVIVAMYVGQWLDEKYHLGGLGLVGMIVIGFIGWLTHVLVAVRGFDAADKKAESDKGLKNLEGSAEENAKDNQ
jgi:F0F1-type ATP synthase assembly protein I